MSIVLPAARLVKVLDDSTDRCEVAFCLQVRVWSGSFAWENAGILVVSSEEIRWVVSRKFDSPLGDLLLPMDKWKKEIQTDRPTRVLMLKSAELVSKAIEFGSALTEYPELPGSLEGDRPVSHIEGVESSIAKSDWAFTG